MVTDKNKEQFKKWYRKEFSHRIFGGFGVNICFADIWKLLPFRMQIGVYLAYYDSLGIDVNAIKLIRANNSSYWCGLADRFVRIESETRNEAYKEAFKKADELINKQLN